MSIYNYEAMDSTGLEFKDTIEAESEKEATAKIREMGLFVTRIRLQQETASVSITVEEYDNKDTITMILFCVVFVVALVIGLIL